MTARRKHQSLRDIAYEEIKGMIFSGRLLQGDRIIIDEMARTIELSITPIREALNKLEQEGLIQSSPRSSYRVVTLERSDIEAVYDLRLLIETYALENSGENFALFPVDKFQKLNEKVLASDNYRQFIESDILFHKHIVELCERKMVSRTFDSIYNFVRLLYIPSAQQAGRLEKACAEHEQILDNIKKKDLDGAVDALKTHIANTKAIALDM
jgi:DNA-binding GntR family transcriptional regulator